MKTKRELRLYFILLEKDEAYMKMKARTVTVGESLYWSFSLESMAREYVWISIIYTTALRYVWEIRVGNWVEGCMEKLSQSMKYPKRRFNIHR